MTLNELKIKESAEIISINCDNVLKNRLYSFGIIKGAIKAISLTPDKDGNVLIDVSLPKGLKTSYQKPIVFQQEMSGTADIVTDDLRLIERLLYQFRDVFKR